MDCQIKHRKGSSKYCGILSKNEGRKKAQGEPVKVGAAKKDAVVEQEGASPGHGSQGRDPWRLDHKVMEDLGRAQGPAPGLHQLVRINNFCDTVKFIHQTQICGLKLLICWI